MGKKRVLYITPGIFPYMAEDYITHVCRYLPQGIQEMDNEIRTFMPKYGIVNERKNLLHEVIRLSGQNIIIEDTDHPLIIKVASLQAVRMQIYFIDSEDFFKRKAVFRDADGKFFEDNDSRAIFFAKGVIETVRKLCWTPDVIHCHGWITALVPIFIKTCYKDNPLFQDLKIVFSAYNDDFSEKFSPDFAKKLKLTGIPKESLAKFRTPGYDALLKTAIDYSDGLVLGHPDVKATVQSYMEKSELPLLKHDENGNYVEQYNAFYDQLIAQ